MRQETLPINLELWKLWEAYVIGCQEALGQQMTSKEFKIKVRNEYLTSIEECQTEQDINEVLAFYRKGGDFPSSPDRKKSPKDIRCSEKSFYQLIRSICK